MQNPTFAGFVPRLIGYIIDTIVITLVALVAAFSATIIGNLSNEQTLELAYIVSGLATFPCVIGFWAISGATPGRLLLGMRIVGPDGSTSGLGFGRAIAHFLASLLSAIPCYLGFIWILIDTNNQGWRDKIARHPCNPSAIARAFPH